MAVTEGQFAPGSPAPGDVWIRLSPGGIRQRYEWMEDKLDGVPAAYGWVGWPPQAGPIGQHFQKQSNAHYHGSWIGAERGIAIAIPIETDALTWTLSHNLAYPFVNVTCIKAESDWTFNSGTQMWTDPQATTRPVTLLMGKLSLLTANIARVEFAEAVRGLALVRR